MKSSQQKILQLNSIYAGYGDQEVLKGVFFSVERGEKWAVIGRNGTGKSTLIKLAAGILNTKRGEIIVDGMNLTQISPKKRARTIGYVPQKPDGVIPYTVQDFVMLGRYSLMGVFGMASKDDRDAVAEAMELCDIIHLEKRLMSTLSGGELQRVLLAGSVAQHTPLLLLDEPTTYLDPAHERLFFDALSRIQNQRELSIVMITHDINIALIHCTHVCALLNGYVVFSGTTEEFKEQCPNILDRIFGVSFKEYQCIDEDVQAFGAWGLTCQL
ncbi:ABC transporter ATP-binding protein [Chitinispirillales bacterium ANBcel5]|uniref:ABC transporter ATP-binding protein n=1 Tax=Cellulosispirillum alkaliphilum TaxID=3039283 RepID=UPI002A596533|nr:ABC transporter ATP-binding protein [Chitinispirillales bacterium ANBcel5]